MEHFEGRNGAVGSIEHANLESKGRNALQEASVGRAHKQHTHRQCCKLNCFFEERGGPDMGRHDSGSSAATPAVHSPAMAMPIWTTRILLGEMFPVIFPTTESANFPFSQLQEKVLHGSCLVSRRYACSKSENEKKLCDLLVFGCGCKDSSTRSRPVQGLTRSHTTPASFSPSLPGPHHAAEPRPVGWAYGAAGSGIMGEGGGTGANDEVAEAGSTDEEAEDGATDEEKDASGSGGGRSEASGKAESAGSGEENVQGRFMREDPIMYRFCFRKEAGESVQRVLEMRAAMDPTISSLPGQLANLILSAPYADKHPIPTSIVDLESTKSIYRDKMAKHVDVPVGFMEQAHDAKFWIAVLEAAYENSTRMLPVVPSSRPTVVSQIKKKICPDASQNKRSFSTAALKPKSCSVWVGPNGDGSTLNA